MNGYIHLDSMRDLERIIPTTCKSCNQPIVFKRAKNGMRVPFEPNSDTPHWDVCPFSVDKQKKNYKAGSAPKDAE